MPNAQSADRRGKSSRPSSSITDIYVYTLTYTTSGQVHTSTCQDWAADTQDFHTLSACPGTDPDATTTSDTGVSFTLRNYSSLTTSSTSSTTVPSNLTTTAVSGVSTTSASVTSAEISGGTASGSAASASSSSTSSASSAADVGLSHMGYLALLSGIYALVA